MTPAQATARMRERADAIAIARARMASQMRAIVQMAGKHGLRSMMEAEFEKIGAEGANDNGVWVG